MTDQIKVKKVKPVTIEPTGRVLRGQSKVHVDKYKLLVASDVYNMAPTQMGDKPAIAGISHAPEYVSREHCHFYYTYDSSGKKQTRSTSQAGHFHMITEVPQGEGKPPKIVVGPAVKEVRKKDKRTHQWVITYAPADDDKETVEECHTHEYEYLWSDETQVRSINMKAVAIETQEANKTAPVKGVLA